MMARSPRLSAPASSSRIAVLLPVPVVPMILKCLVSSSGATGKPAKVISVALDWAAPAAAGRNDSARVDASLANAERVAPAWAAAPLAGDVWAGAARVGAGLTTVPR